MYCINKTILKFYLCKLYNVQCCAFYNGINTSKRLGPLLTLIKKMKGKNIVSSVFNDGQRSYSNFS